MNAVSNDQHWQAPGGTQPPPPAGPPSAGAGPGAYYAPPPVAPTAQGWTPPPKPGLVPLRPMTLGTILGASFQVMRRNPRATIVPGLLTALLLAIAVSIGVVLIFGALGRISTTTDTQDAGALAAGTFAIALLVLVAGGALSVVATALLQAIIVTEVARGTVGEKLRLGQIWAAARGRFGAMIGYTVLQVLAIVLGFALFYAVIIGVTLATVGVSGSSTSTGSIMGAVFATFGVTILAFLGGAALFLWLSTKLAFVPAAIVLERLPVGRAIARSWALTRGYFWRTLGILLLVEVMVWIATNIVAVPLQLVLSLGATLLDPTGAGSVSTDAAGAGAAVAIIVSYAIVSIVSAIGMVLISATSSLLYLDLRMRKEGLDLELARFVEARQTGADVPDPYRRG
jgi:hypothetical protein